MGWRSNQIVYRNLGSVPEIGSVPWDGVGGTPQLGNCKVLQNVQMQIPALTSTYCLLNNRTIVNSLSNFLLFTSHSCIRPQAVTGDWCTDSFAFALYRRHPHPVQCKYYAACPQLAMSVSSCVLAWVHRYCSLRRIQLGAEGKPPPSHAHRFTNGPPPPPPPLLC